jgi:hypothetical protein
MLFFGSKKKDDETLQRAIQELVRTGEAQKILSNVRFADAQRYAAERGATMSPYKNDPENDCLLFDANVGGSAYRVCFQRWLTNDVLVSVETARSASDVMAQAFGEGSGITQLFREEEQRRKNQK